MLNMKFQPQIDQFSLTALPIHIDEGIHATAFFYEKNNDIYLITNWHVLSGLRSDNYSPLSKSRPQEIRIQFFTGCKPQDLEKLIQYSTELQFSPMETFQLYYDNGKARWLEHPEYGSKTDIAALKILIPKDNFVLPINKYSLFNMDMMHVAVSMDVFILGFPKKLYTKNVPIWKRGTIASEYHSKLEGIPAFLVDTSTYYGMSGSPVILRRHGGYETTWREQIMGTGTKFLGVYAGRYFPDGNQEVQLGIVYKKELIDDIITHGRSGKALD